VPKKKEVEVEDSDEDWSMGVGHDSDSNASSGGTACAAGAGGARDCKPTNVAGDGKGKGKQAADCAESDSDEGAFNLKRNHLSQSSTQSNLQDDSGIEAFRPEIELKRVKIWWDREETWYAGVVKKYDAETSKILVLYDDNDKRWHDEEEAMQGWIKWEGQGGGTACEAGAGGGEGGQGSAAARAPRARRAAAVESVAKIKAAKKKLAQVDKDLAEEEDRELASILISHTSNMPSPL